MRIPSGTGHSLRSPASFRMWDLHDSPRFCVLKTGVFLQLLATSADCDPEVKAALQHRLTLTGSLISSHWTHGSLTPL